MRNHLGPRKRSLFWPLAPPKPMFAHSPIKELVHFLINHWGQKTRETWWKSMNKFAVTVSFPVLGRLRFSSCQHHPYEHGDDQRGNNHVIQRYRHDDRRNNLADLYRVFWYPCGNRGIFGLISLQLAYSWAPKEIFLSPSRRMKPPKGETLYEKENRSISHPFSLLSAFRVREWGWRRPQRERFFRGYKFLGFVERRGIDLEQRQWRWERLLRCDLCSLCGQCHPGNRASQRVRFHLWWGFRQVYRHPGGWVYLQHQRYT